MKIKLSRSQWEGIGKKAGWDKDDAIDQRNEIYQSPANPEGTYYTHNPKDAQLAGMIPFKYRQTQLASGKTFDKTVWCNNANDFAKLLKSWDNDKYIHQAV